MVNTSVKQATPAKPAEARAELAAQEAAVTPTLEETVASAQAAYNAAAARLRALEQEQAGIPGRLSQAAQQADASVLAILKKRRDALVDEVATARIIACRLEIDLIDAQLAEKRAEADQAAPAVGRAQEAIATARAALETALRAHGLAQGNLHAAQLGVGNLVESRGALTRRLDVLIAEAAGTSGAKQDN